MSKIFEDKELLGEFLSETEELIESMDDDLVALEKAPSDVDLLNRVFRTVHTIKGTASFLGFEALVMVAHKAEDVLNRLRKSEIVVTPIVMDAILEAVDVIKVLLDDVRSGELRDRAIEPIIERLVVFLEEGYAVPTLDPGAQQAGVGESVVSAGLGDTVETVPVPAEASVNVPTPAPAKPEREARHDDVTDNSTVRVDVKRLDDLLNQVGELVLERNRLLQLTSDFHADVRLNTFPDDFAQLSKRMNFITSELQTQVLKMRMMAVGKVFRKFPKIVRNIARDVGKEVQLRLSGEDAEVDRSIIDELGDPLVHLIRNALDHGLETPDVRIAAGKNPCGTIELSAMHEGNNIIISIKDDGRGIDRQKVAQKAVDKGLFSAEVVAGMSDREVFELIFLPGFSTKETVTNLSGRGVGMDVVRSNIKKLNGVIDIRSELGAGTEITLRLPLTLAIIQSLMVGVGAEVYSIPLSSVIETLKVDVSEFKTVGGRNVLNHSVGVIPLVEMSDIFGATTENDRPYRYVVVIGIAEKRLGVIVDYLLGQQENAIKSLGEYLPNIYGIAGSTILGDGRVALIVNPAALLDARGSSSGG